MPRPKKPPGQAVDARNGARLSLVTPAQAPTSGIPAAPAGLGLDELRQWDTFWSAPQAQLLLETEHIIVARYVDALARYRRATELGDANPVTSGSQGQDVESPYYSIADRALKTAERCEAQLGIGPMARMKLGVQVGEASRSLSELNAALMGGDASDDGDADPRVIDPRLASS